jgi:hypothetical protein
LAQELTWKEKCFISPCFAFAQIYKLYDYGQYRMHGIVINLLTNVDQTQLILQCLSYDETTI